MDCIDLWNLYNFAQKTYSVINAKLRINAELRIDALFCELFALTFAYLTHFYTMSDNSEHSEMTDGLSEEMEAPMNPSILTMMKEMQNNIASLASSVGELKRRGETESRK